METLCPVHLLIINFTATEMSSWIFSASTLRVVHKQTAASRSAKPSMILQQEDGGWPPIKRCNKSNTLRHASNLGQVGVLGSGGGGRGEGGGGEDV